MTGGALTGGGLRAAIVGCGRIAGGHLTATDGPVWTHAQAYVRHGATTLAGACDPDPIQRQRFAALWQVPVYETAVELLERQRPDVISICSPNRFHAEHLVLAAARPDGPRAVFVEKPICLEPDELTRIEKALGDGLRDGAARPAPHVLVNHTRRYDRAHQRVAAAARAGEYGRLLGGRIDYYGGWLHNGTHLVDLLRMVCGDVAVTATAPGAVGRNGDDCPNVWLDAAGAEVVMYGFDERHYQLFEVDLRFARARVLFEDFGGTIRVQLLAENALGERYLDAPAEERMRGLQEPLLNAVDALVRAVAEGAPIEPTGATVRDAAATMQVMWEAVASCRS
jgi:predicted dehydrogenase